MTDTSEFETHPVSPDQLQPARYFAASYAGEHVAGTEFVIGAMFVAWGVGTHDILWGLLWGNLLAVLTWVLVCAPIAVDTRLTLYAYLERIAGPGTVKLYSAVNGILFCILAGAMITVSASAVRILFDVPAQVNWYPTNLSFVAIALAVGAVVVWVAVNGFRRVAQFAEVCAPWMILMFVAGAMAVYPALKSTVIEEGRSDDFMSIANHYIWRGDKSELGIWHVAAFAWICNLAMHGGLSDMTVLRFAKKSSYGFFSALGMFIGHYLAWVCAGIMGAAAAMAMNTSIVQLDAGAVAFNALGAAGILAVIIAGWTTSNPTIYRAGLAFQSINPKWDRVRVTIVTGIVTTIIACFPFVFSKLMDFVGLMGLMLAPIGAVIVTEHWLLPKAGLTRYWSTFKGNTVNAAAVISWAAGLAAGLLLTHLGVHLYFLLTPVWIFTSALYLLLASVMGAKQKFDEAAEQEALESARKLAERNFLTQPPFQNANTYRTTNANLYGALAVLSLLCCLGIAIWAFFDAAHHEALKSWMWLPTITYFITAMLWVRAKE